MEIDSLCIHKIADFRPLPGLPAAAWAAVPQAHARRTVGHLGKKPIYAMVLILDGNSLSSAHGRSYGTIVRKDLYCLTLRLIN